MHLNPNSPLNEWNFSPDEMEQVKTMMSNPMLQAYLQTKLSLMFYQFSEYPSIGAQGNTVAEQERIDKQMLQGARHYHNSLLSILTEEV